MDMIRTPTPERGVDRTVTSWDLLAEARVELALAVPDGDLVSVRAWLRQLEHHAGLLGTLDDDRLRTALAGTVITPSPQEIRRRDQAARTRARYYGYAIRRSAVTGGFRIVSRTTGETVAGFTDDLSLDAVTDYFDGLASDRPE